jgi:hypothetical protein
MSSKILITIKRGGCFGPCPIYSAQIYEDGTVLYKGELFVKVEGKRQYKISQGKIKQLIEEFQRINYFSLKDKYEKDEFGVSISCQSTRTTSINLNGQKKQVVNYYGAPEMLDELEDKIDEVAELNNLIGKENENY